MAVHVFGCLAPLALLSVAAGADFAAGPEIKSAKIIVYGVFEPIGQNRTYGRDKTETINARFGFRNIKETDIIPASIGTHFGLHYRLTGSPLSHRKDVLIGIEWTYPGMGILDPDTRKYMKSFAYQQYVTLDRKLYLGQLFESKESMVEGKWKLQVTTDDGNLLFQKEFHVVRP